MNTLRLACVGRSCAMPRLTCLPGSRLVNARATGRGANWLGRTMCSKAPEAKPATWMEMGQIDSGFFQGTGLFAGVLAYAYMATDTQKAGHIGLLVSAFRKAGIDAKTFPDKCLVEDYIKKNFLAAQNVIVASPTFYFMFHSITGQSLLASLMRSVTGTMRIVPFMFLFYGAYACVAPFATSALMARGQSYQEANSNAGIAVMLGGFVFVEAIVELRGVGVTFSQMTFGSLAIFIPSLVGRLATGVLTQQQKVGQVSEGVLPESWKEGSDWQRQVWSIFEKLHLDKDFFTTAVGTSVFQHILNGISFVLLIKGNKTGMRDIFSNVFFGLNNTVASGLLQFGKTFVMRCIFGWTWNFVSSQPREIPCFDQVPPSS